MKTVIKRDGRRKEFNSKFIDIAISKAEEEVKGISSDLGIRVASLIEDYLDENSIEEISIEQIQDLIEASLQKLKYDDVYKSFSEYRERRTASRQLFADEKKMHKFLKTLESLGLKSAHEEDAKRENANVDGDTAMGTMLQYGSTVSKEFAKSYLMKKKFADAHDSGDIHIHDLDFMPMGTTTCLQIDLNKLFKNAYKLACKRVEEETHQAMESVIFNLNSMHSRAGSQVE